MHSAIVGGYEARQALWDHAPNTDWCVGGCDHWSKTREGGQRYAELKERWDALKKQQEHSPSREKM